MDGCTAGWMDRLIVERVDGWMVQWNLQRHARSQHAKCKGGEEKKKRSGVKKLIQTSRYG